MNRYVITLRVGNGIETMRREAENIESLYRKLRREGVIAKLLSVEMVSRNVEKRDDFAFLDNVVSEQKIRKAVSNSVISGDYTQIFEAIKIH